MITKGNCFDLLSNSCNKINICFEEMPVHSGYWGLLRFSKTCKLWSSKAAFTHALFAAVSHIRITSNEPWNTETQKTDEIHQSQTMTFWTSYSKVLFPKRSAKKIDGSEKCKRQLAFELQNSCVFEKLSKGLVFSSGFEKSHVQSSGMTSFSAEQVTVKAHLH